MYYKTDAVVLKKTKLNDSDVILTLFTRKVGKTSVIVSGGRNPKSKLSSAAHPFVFGEYVFSYGGKWNKLTSVELKDSFYSIREDLERLAYASYILELTNVALMEGVPNDRLFVNLVETLNIIAKGDCALDLIKVAYELKLMDSLGYRPELVHCVSCGTTELAGFNFSVIDGGMLCEHCSAQLSRGMKIGKTIPKLMHYLIVKDMRIINRTQVNVSYIKKLDIIISKYILFHLEKKRFKSLEFLNNIRELKE